MSLVTEEGILLRAHPYSESSRTLRFLTPTYGVLAVMAKGVRRRGSKGEGFLGTFDQVSLTFYWKSGRDLHTLREADVIRSRRGLGADLARFTGASLLAELLLVHTLEEANPALFQGVTAVMDALDRAEDDVVAGVILAGAWSLLGEAGFPPVLERCARCGASLPAEGLLRFSAAEGGLVCAGCGGLVTGARVGPGARDDLRRLAAGAPVASLRGAGAHLGLLEGFAAHHLSPRRPFRSVEMLRRLLETKEEATGTKEEGRTEENR